MRRTCPKSLKHLRRETVVARLPAWIVEWLHNRKDSGLGIGMTIERALLLAYQLSPPSAGKIRAKRQLTNKLEKKKD